MKIKCKFIGQTRHSPDGNTVKDYFPGDVIILEEADARGTILHPSRPNIAIEVPMEEEPETSAPPAPPTPPEENHGPRPDQQDIDELETEDDEEEEDGKQEEIDLENKQEKAPVDRTKAETETVISPKLKTKGKK